MANDHISEDEWKREVHAYIDEQIENHNSANQKEFRTLRDGQLKLEVDIAGVEDRLTGEIRKVLAASAEAHKEIIERLERLENSKD